LIIFDLDNTLFDETTYLFPAYEAISKIAAPENDSLAGQIRCFLQQTFLATGRAGLLDAMREKFPGLGGNLMSWLAAMRTLPVPGGIPFLEWVEPFCADLPSTPLAILTNGNTQQQENKFRQLTPPNLRERFRLYCAAKYVPKPSPTALYAILREFHCDVSAALCVGDAETDRLCAERAGVAFTWAPGDRADPS
jgi:FMN phosphatase YigB (HAD superfamily)